jgi:hypothetical protein
LDQSLDSRPDEGKRLVRLLRREQTHW